MKNLSNMQVQLLTYLTCVIWRVVLGKKKKKGEAERIKKIVVKLYRAFKILDDSKKIFMNQEFVTLSKKTVRTTKRSTLFSAQGTLLLGIFACWSPSAVNYALSNGSFILGLLWWKIFTDEAMDHERFKQEAVFLLARVGEDEEKNFRRLDSAYKLAGRILKSCES